MICNLILHREGKIVDLTKHDSCNTFANNVTALLERKQWRFLLALGSVNVFWQILDPEYTLSLWEAWQGDQVNESCKAVNTNQAHSFQDLGTRNQFWFKTTSLKHILLIPLPLTVSSYTWILSIFLFHYPQRLHANTKHAEPSVPPDSRSNDF